MLHLAWHPAVYLSLLVITLAFAVWSYRHTPHLSRRQWLLLTLLRSSTLGVLLTLLADPLLLHTQRRHLPAELAVLIDDSASMPLAARDSSQRLAMQLQQAIPWAAFRSAHLHLYRLGTELQPLPPDPRLLDDLLRFRQTRTDLNQAILKAWRRHPQLRALVLISDGQFNTGPSPLYEAERLGLPVFTVAVGDTTRPQDVWIDRIETNTIAYVRSRLPITVYLQARGLAQTTATLLLEVNGQEIGRQRHLFTSPEEQATLTFTYEPEHPGLHQIRVRVLPVTGEFSQSNNEESTAIRVLERRRRILLIGAAPDPDLATLQRLLGRNLDLEVTTRVQRDAHRFYGGTLPDTLDAFDLIILAGYPGQTSNITVVERIATAIKQVPVWFLLNAHTELRLLRRLADALPARPEQILSGHGAVSFRIRPDARVHAVLDLPNGIPETLDRLPPLRTTRSLWTVAPDARWLAVGYADRSEAPVPLLLVQERNGHRRAALLGSGIWRWSSLPASFDELRVFWETLFDNLIQWLTAPTLRQQVRIWPERDVFGEDEPVRLLAEVYNERMLPVDNAMVTVEVRSSDSTPYSFHMEAVGEGRYRLEIDNLPQGLYRYHGEAFREIERLGSDSGHFIVGATAVEFKTPWADYGLLRQLARRTKGHFFTLENADKLPEVLQRDGLLTPEEIQVQAEWRPRLTWPPLLMIILLLSAEWILRKRFGIA